MSFGGSTAVEQMYTVLMARSVADKFPVVDLMNATKGFKAFDSCEELYAILGLSQEYGSAIVPDYFKPPESVYRPYTAQF